MKFSQTLFTFLSVWMPVALWSRIEESEKNRSFSETRGSWPFQTSQQSSSQDNPTGIAHFPLGKISFADSIILYDPGALGEGTGDEPSMVLKKPERALGIPDSQKNSDSSYVSLGKGGNLILKFTNNVLIDGPGPDLYIFEVNTDDEDTFVWISQDGNIFIPVGKASKENPGIDIQPYVEPGTAYSYVKLRDDPAQGEESGSAAGADIDAVGAINSAIRIEIPSDQLFESKTARLSADAPTILSEIAEKIRLIPHARVSIEIHTDSWGTEDYNLLNSQQQAGAVQNYFMDVENLTEVNYTTIGWGESRPIASNDTEEGSYRNRRVEILIQLIHDKFSPD